MRKILAAALVTIAPVVLPVGPVLLAAPVYAATTPLGDLSPLSAIVTDTESKVGSGDLAAAQRRITDFESAWDRAAPTLQPKNPELWHTIDAAADRAIGSLRATKPDAGLVRSTLAELSSALADPKVTLPTSGSSGKATASALSISNADGSALPCEVVLKTVRDAASAGAPSDQESYDALLNKGIERCNADDDKRADGFFAQAYGLLG